MTYLLMLLALLGVAITVQVRWVYRRRRLLAESWETVLGRAHHVDLEGIRTIADCYLHPDKDQLRIEPVEMWRLLGGSEGLNRLHENAQAMLDLAVYAQRWDDEHGAVIAEMIRRDASRLQRSVTRIQLAYFLGLGFLRAPFYMREAAGTYYLMRGRLLGMYENCHVGLAPRLAAAL